MESKTNPAVPSLPEGVIALVPMRNVVQYSRQFEPPLVSVVHEEHV